MLTMTDIAHTYTSRKAASVQALRGVTLTARAGAVTALVGPNGSGKSTLFRLVTGTLALQQGSVRMNDAPMQHARMGVVFQSPALDEQLTVFENMRYHAMLYGMRLSRATVPGELLDVLELSDKLDQRISALSGGYRRRVELAKALLPDPGLLVLDEPFTGLDVGVRDAFFSVLQEITMQRGLTTFLITHELGIASQCDHVILLEEGTVIADDTPGQLLREFGSTVVEITTSDVPAMEHTLAAAANPPAVMRLRENVLLVKDCTLHEVLRSIDERDPRILDMQVRRPSLEDYFIARTGHALHADAEGRMAA